MRNIKFLFIGLAILSLSSCKMGYKQGEYPLEFENEISGIVSEYYKVTNAYLRVNKKNDSKIFVEVKKTSQGLPFNPDKVEFCPLAESYNKWTITADIYEKNNLPIFPNLVLFEQISYLGLAPGFGRFLILEEGETCWLEFKLGRFRGKSELNNKPKIAKKVKLNFYLNL